MSLRRCLIDMNNIILGRLLYLINLHFCLGLGLFVSYPCELFFINHVILLKYTYFNAHSLEYTFRLAI